jgi:hypothetical protein
VSSVSSEEIHRFHPTNGRVTGVLGLAVCLLVAVLTVIDASTRSAVTVVLGCLFFAALFWAALLRPRVWAEPDQRLVIQTMFTTISIPLAAIESAVVRRFLVVSAGGNRYICPAISRPLRKTVDADMSFRRSPLRTPEVKGEHDMYYPDFVEEQIERFAREDRLRRGIEERSEEEYELAGLATRTPAWPEIAGVVVLGVAFAVALVV